MNSEQLTENRKIRSLEDKRMGILNFGFLLVTRHSSLVTVS
ncbi:MAG: hypothetical protein AAB089_05070 [Nitrospirota bacterium]